jgi:hypothetical protein
MWSFNDETLKALRNSDIWEQADLEDPEALEVSDETIGLESMKDAWYEEIPLRVLFDKSLSAAQIKRYAERAARPAPGAPGEEEPGFSVYNPPPTAPFNAAFRRWFGDSKVVDANGNPLVVYHGGATGLTVFRAIAYFTNHEEEAREYAGPDGVVVPVYLRILRPYEMDAYDQGQLTEKRVKALKNLGYDGIIGEGTYHNLHFVVFEPTQIKSATGNDGTWDPDDPSIMSNPQLYTSAETSQKQLPGLFKAWQRFRGFQGLNLDLGGGKYDLVQDWMYQSGIPCTNLVFDPFNRSEAYNQHVLARISAAGGADSVTIANVLNVIDDFEARLQLLRQAGAYAKPGAPIIVSVYERNGDGVPTVTKSDSWQANRKLEEYLPEVQAVLGQAHQAPGKLLIAHAIGVHV